MKRRIVVYARVASVEQLGVAFAQQERIVDACARGHDHAVAAKVRESEIGLGAAGLYQNLMECFEAERKGIFGEKLPNKRLCPIITHGVASFPKIEEK